MYKEVVYLEDIVDAMDAASDHWEQYLNVKTGKIVPLFDINSVHISEENKAKSEEILLSHHYLLLPGYIDINELLIMRGFIETCKNLHQQERLSHALKRLIPGRLFKQMIEALDLAEEYYDWRRNELLGIARAWCECHDIPFKCNQEQLDSWDEELDQEVV